MAKQTAEICCESSGISFESENSEDQDDTLEAEISRLEATLHELDENDLSEFCSTENLGDDDLNDSDSYEEIIEKTITNNDSDLCEDINENTIININVVVPTCTVVAESDKEKQQWSATESWDSNKPPENETIICKEVLCSDQSKVTNVKELCAVSTRVSNRMGENEGSESSLGSIISVESQKTSESNATSSEFLCIHPTIDNELEALINSPITSSVQITNASLEFSPFRTFKNSWFTSSPKITNLVESQQSKLTFPSPHTEIQTKLASLVSLPQDKFSERDEQALKGNLGISELQSSSQKPTIQQLVKDAAECNLESQNNKESLDSVIILEECNLKKVSSGSFLDLDVSQDYEKEWLTVDKDGKWDSIGGPVSSTPFRKEPSSLLKSKFCDFHNDGSFIVLDETGEDAHDDDKTKTNEPFSAGKSDAKDLDSSVKEIKYVPKNVELGDNQVLNISVEHVAIVEHPIDTISANNDKVTKPEVPHIDDKRDEGYVKTIEVIKSDYLFKSEDPEENADNFNPEWELLRKLQTDEERYKAMRERWRNLVIPDPNLDLTHHTWRLQRNKSKTLPAKGSNETQFMFRKPLAESRHKRTLSDPSSSSEERSAKRSRTQSCTMLFDVKLQQLRQEIDVEQHRLLYEEAQAVENLRNAQAIQKVQLQHYCHGYQFMSQLHSLHQEYLQNEELIRMQYKGARCQAECAQEMKIHSLQKASAEVRAFHKFYQGLENKEDNDTSAYLSETQLEELWETENFYEECEKFYT